MIPPQNSDEGFPRSTLRPHLTRPHGRTVPLSETTDETRSRTTTMMTIAMTRAMVVVVVVVVVIMMIEVVIALSKLDSSPGFGDVTRRDVTK